MNENKDLELMTTEEDYDVVGDDNYTDVEGGSGKVIGLVVAGLAGAAALGVAAYKKVKAKKSDKPKKKRKKLMLVEVEDDIDETEEIVEADAVEVDEETEK